MWSEKHRPASSEEMVGNVEPRRKIVAWLQKWKPGMKALLILGPPGVGKTTAVHVTARSLKMNLVELNASDTRTRERLSKRLEEILTSTNLFGEKTMVFLDEVDGLAGRSDYGAIDYIKGAVKESVHPILMAANDAESDEVKKMGNAVTKVHFERPSPSEVAGKLREVAMSGGLHVSEEDIQRIVSSANGDLRSAINALQTGLPAVRDEELTSSESVNAFFGSSDMKAALKALRSYPGQPRDKVRDIFLAVVKAKASDEEKAAALDAVSTADVLVGRIFRGQDWRLLRYLDPLLAAGLTPLGAGKASFTTEGAPWLLQLRIWNDSRRLREIAASAASKLGNSSKGFMVQDLPYLVAMSSNEEFRGGLVRALEMDEGYLTFLEKESSRSSRR